MPSQLSLEALKNRFLNKLTIPIETAEKEAYFVFVLQEVFNLEQHQYFKHKSMLFPDTILEQFDLIIYKINQSIPIQYIFNKAYFYKHQWYVSEGVLIPRPETEELVDWIVNDFRNNTKTLTFVEIGIGSGCILVSLASELNTNNYIGYDIEPQALKATLKNAKHILTQTHNIQLKKVDFLSYGIIEPNRLDVIVSNPPYISFAENISMDKHVLDFEPHIALFVPDSDPLVFYRKLAEEGLRSLNPSGKIYVEINPVFSAQTSRVFRDRGYKVEVKKDMQGKDRMICATYVPSF